MYNWIIEDFVKSIAPRVIAALLALAAAHSTVLTNWGISVNWATLQGKLTQGAAVLIGIALAHHVSKAVKSTPPPAAEKSN